MVLLREIKRRRVLHTLSLYIVGCWVALQVVEVLSDAGLPPQTMRYLLFAMSVGFPLVLLVAWFFDVSVDGITRTPPRADDSELPTLNLGDHALLIGLLGVLALNAWILSMPQPTQGGGITTDTTGHTLVVMGFEDRGDVGEEETIGDAIAGELRGEFQRLAGVRVLGPESSRALQAAGDARDELASELGVNSILSGEVQLHDGRLELDARVVRLPGGNVVWQSAYSADVSEGPDLHRRIVRAIVEAVIPSANADAATAPRTKSGECASVYELYLRASQLSAVGMLDQRIAARELLKQAVQADPQCGIAWEALAVASIDWTKEGFARAGAAARRALEIHESLAGAWATLAEIAEEEMRWSEAERLFLRALYVNPADARVNAMYAETLMARGRVSTALAYALDAYRYDPASSYVNFIASLTARYAGDADLLLKHSRIFAEIRGNLERYYWDEPGEAYILKGDFERAAAIFDEKVGVYVEDWYPQCVRSLGNPDLRDGLIPRVEASLQRYRNKELMEWRGYYVPWHAIRCAMFLERADLAVDLADEFAESTEQRFAFFFQQDAKALRQTERFRQLVVEEGLLDYWREWGFSDYCRPDGDSFACD
jgi:TolB-like protein/Flp pilus assembly protein TadD